MGKSLVIKGANFATNAIGSQAVIWRTSLSDGECFSGSNNRSYGLSIGYTYFQNIPSIANKQVKKIWVKIIPYNNPDPNGGYYPNIRICNSNGAETADISLIDGDSTAHIHEITLSTPISIGSDGALGIKLLGYQEKRNYYCFLINAASECYWVNGNQELVTYGADIFYKIETE